MDYVERAKDDRHRGFQLMYCSREHYYRLKDYQWIVLKHIAKLAVSTRGTV